MSKTFPLPRHASVETVIAERRQEERFPLNLLGEIKVIDKAGLLLIEKITIEEWSDAGCRFETAIPLKAGDIVAIKPLETAKDALQDWQPHLFEIAWTNRRIACWVAGPIKLPDEKRASIKFPPANYAPERPSK